MTTLQIEDLVVQEWKKRDPYLLDFEGYLEFLDDLLRKMQKLEGWQRDASILDWAHDNIQRKKYATVGAVFAYCNREGRYSGLMLTSITSINYLQVLDLIKERERQHYTFLCIEIIHEKILDHDPERPHVKGTFSLHTYYDINLNQIEKPLMMKKIEKHLSKVSRWYSSPTKMETEPYPTAPLWEE